MPVQWEDLPSDKRNFQYGRRIPEEVLSELRDKPGTWAVIETGPTGSITSRAYRYRRAYKGEGFEFATRSQDLGYTSKLYARYVN